MEGGRGSLTSAAATSPQQLAPLLAAADEGQDSSGDHSTATPVLVLSTFVAVCGSFTYGCVSGYSSPAESGIVADLDLSSAEYAVFGSILTVGGMVGSILSGKTADKIGRKRTMWISNTLCAIGWFAIAFAQDALCLDLGRLSLGFGLGLIGYVIPVYIAEITPSKIRGGFLTCHQLMLCFGISTMFFIGTAVSWRVLALIGSVASFVQIGGLFLIPESPRWLAKVGREKELEAALGRLRGRNVDISIEASEILDYTRNFEQLSKAKFLDLFDRRYTQALVVGVGLSVLQQCNGSNAILYYASDIFDTAGFSSRIGSIGMATIQIPAVLLGVFLMDRSGRRPLLLVSIVGMCLSFLLIGASFLLQDFDIWGNLTPILVFIGILLYCLSFSIGFAAIPAIIMAEIFPINMKGSAGSLVTLSTWVSAWILTYAFSFLLDWSSAGVFFMFSAVAGITIVFVVKLVPETKLRTLEEIQASMTGFT